MKKVLLALAGAAFASSVMANPTCVFRAGSHDPTLPDDVTPNPSTRADGGSSQYVAGTADERGDEVTLAAGTPRNITEMSVQLVGYLNPPAGDEFIRIRLYKMDGPAVGTRADSPSTLLWDSGSIPAKSYVGYVRFKVPNIVVPDRIAWTVTPIGTTQTIPTDYVGPAFLGPPTTGTTDVNLWRRTVAAPTVWVNTNYPSVQGDLALGQVSPCFAMTMWADGGPTVPYDAFDAASNYTTAVWTVDPSEIGDDFSLEGNSRNLTEFDFGYVSDFTAPVGTEAATLRLYKNDYASGLIQPELAPFYTSAAVLIDTTAGIHTLTVTEPAGVIMPDDGAWTVQFPGTAVAGDEAGPIVCHHPAKGDSDGRGFYTYAVGTWNGYWWGQPMPTSNNTTTPGGNMVANFAAAFVSTIVDYSTVSVGPGSTVAPSVPENAFSYSTADVRWNVRPGAILVATADPAVATFNFYLPVSAVTTMNVVVQSKATVGDIRQKVDIKSGTSTAFTNLHTVGTPGAPNDGLPFGAAPDQDLDLVVPTPATYIDTANQNKVVIRLAYKNMSAVLVYPWQAQIDACYVKFTP
jgi:hypothetical protein